jgi:hypothetical protein
MSEFAEHKQICQYIRYQYPDVIFFSDLSGIKMSIGLAVKLKSLKSSKGIPDLFIAEPKNGYNGLFLEIKETGKKVFKKDTVTPIDDHVAQQIHVLTQLRGKGYKAGFAFGYEDAIKIIDNYFK